MEINPFHNGHKYFLSQIPKSDRDLLIVVLSTTIVQRGELSVLTKKVKTELLLNNNVDIVVELPAVLANQGGLYFASHAISILKQFNITHLCFGSEQNDLNLLQNIIEKPQTFDFTKGIHTNFLENLKSNDILGISYLQAIKHTDIKPFLIKRTSNQYNDVDVKQGLIQSATAIRNQIELGNSVEMFLPKYSLANIKSIDNNLLFDLFVNNMHNAIDNDIKIFLAEDNQLLNKMHKILKNNKVTSLSDLVNLSRDKNNSKYKLMRVVMNTILMVRDNCDYGKLDYIHILGFTENGRKYCKKLNNKLFVTSLKNQKSKLALCEIRASKLAERVANFESNQDFQQPVIK